MYKYRLITENNLYKFTDNPRLIIIVNLDWPVLPDEKYIGFTVIKALYLQIFQIRLILIAGFF